MRKGIVGYDEAVDRRLHACALARTLGLKRILVPPDPGTFSALGLASSAATWEASRTVLRRFAETSEIAAAVGYLLSDDAGFCCGTELLIDGGYSLW